MGTRFVSVNIAWYTSASMQKPRIFFRILKGFMTKKSMALVIAVVCFLSCPGLLWAEKSVTRISKTMLETDYKVGVGDIIYVAVLQPDPMETTLTVAPDGSVAFPQIGQIVVLGLSPLEIQEKIQESLREYINYPLVSVSLKESHSQNFYIYGEVLRPGIYPLKEKSTVLQAIALAGGFTRVASLDDIKVVRQNSDTLVSKTIKVDLSGSGHDGATDVFKLESGDVVTVSRNSDVYVYGEVGNPGPYSLEENTTILQAIVMAGGFTPVAAMDEVKVMRRGPGGHDNETIVVDLRSPPSGGSMDEHKAEPGDVITVSKRFF